MSRQRKLLPRKGKQHGQVSAGVAFWRHQHCAPRLPQVLADIMNDSEGGDSGGVAVWAAEALLPQVVYSGPHLKGSTISVAGDLARPVHLAKSFGAVCGWLRIVEMVCRLRCGRCCGRRCSRPTRCCATCGRASRWCPSSALPKRSVWLPRCRPSTKGAARADCSACLRAYFLHMKAGHDCGIQHACPGGSTPRWHVLP